MTREQEQRLRERLGELASLRQIYELIRDLAAFEKGSTPLPFFVVKSILQDLAWRLEGLPPESPVMNVIVKIRQQLVPSIYRALDAYGQGDPFGMFNELNTLAGQWVLFQGELR